MNQDFKEATGLCFRFDALGSVFKGRCFMEDALRSVLGSVIWFPVLG